MADEQVLEAQNNGQGPALGSLAERAQARREELQKRHTVCLEPPGYEGLLEVEYRVLTYADIKKIAARNERVSDDAMRDLYMAADGLLTASINSYEIVPGGGRRELGFGWGVQLGLALGYDVEDLTPRQALFACFPRDFLLFTHYNSDYNDWLQGTTDSVDEEQAEDFQPTS
jgi:hypothetical protein